VNRARREQSLQRWHNYREKSEVSNGSSFVVDQMEISLTNVSFHYASASPDDYILQNVVLSTRQGKIIALKGPHGGGKSTTLSIVGHTLFPVSGSVFVPAHLRILSVAENNMIFESWTPFENLAFGLSKDQISEELPRIRKILERLGMNRVLAMVESDLREPTVSVTPITITQNLNPEGSNLSENRPLISPRTLSRECSVRSVTISVNREESMLKDNSTLEEKREHSAGWFQAFSSTELSKFCLARALIANSEILILHKPFTSFEDEAKEQVARSLHEHVRSRGMALPTDTLIMRRPRTCFYSVVDPADVKWSDTVWRIDVKTKSIYVEEPGPKPDPTTPRKRGR